MIYVPLDPTQNLALAGPRQMQHERMEQAAADKRVRRRQNLQRRKAGTTIRPEKWPKGEFRPE